MHLSATPLTLLLLSIVAIGSEGTAGGLHKKSNSPTPFTAKKRKFQGPLDPGIRVSVADSDELIAALDAMSKRSHAATHTKPRDVPDLKKLLPADAPNESELETDLSLSLGLDDLKALYDQLERSHAATHPETMDDVPDLKGLFKAEAPRQSESGVHIYEEAEK